MVVKGDREGVGGGRKRARGKDGRMGGREEWKRGRNWKSEEGKGEWEERGEGKN